MGFEVLGLGDKLLKAINESGYTTPTEIQKQAIPITLMCRDVLGIAQTGTGKTAAFTLPMIEVLAGGKAKARMPRSLILAPTRELAIQIADEFDKHGKYHDLSKTVLVGGTSMFDQVRELEKGVDVLIVTPGRFLDLYDRGNILLADMKILVIDEADRMLDMGFIPDLERIVSLLPPLRQTLFFSATMPDAIKKIADKFLSNPKQIKVARQSSTTDNVEQFIMNLHYKEKLDTLIEMASSKEVENAFVFCNRKKDISGVCRGLEKARLNAGEMHGDMDQKSRVATLDAFKTGEIKFLVCSDVAARGIDVDGVSHVFNYDVPMNAEDYVHRIGRTGRAGNTGKAYMFVTKSDTKFLDGIQDLTKQKLNEYKLGKNTSAISNKSESVSKPKKEYSDNKPKKEYIDNKPKKEHLDKKSNNNQNPKQEPLADNNVKGFGDDVPLFFR